MATQISCISLIIKTISAVGELSSSGKVDVIITIREGGGDRNGYKRIKRKMIDRAATLPAATHLPSQKKLLGKRKVTTATVLGF